MKQQDFSQFVLTDLYYLQEKIGVIRDIVYCSEFDVIFDGVPSGVKTRNDIVKTLDDTKQFLCDAHLAWLNVYKKHFEVQNVSA